MECPSLLSAEERVCAIPNHSPSLMAVSEGPRTGAEAGTVEETKDSLGFQAYSAFFLDFLFMCRGVLPSSMSV